MAIPAAESELAIPNGGERVDHVDLYREYVPMVPVVGSPNSFTADMAKPVQENVACLVHVAESDPNVALIVHAPTDIAALVAEVRALRAVRPTPRAALTVGRLTEVLKEAEAQQVAAGCLTDGWDEGNSDMEKLAAWLLPRLGAASPAAAPPQEEP